MNSSEPTDEVPAQQAKPIPGARMNLAYGKDPLQALDLYVPEKAKGGPLVVFVHGGAWQSGSRHEYDAACAALNKRGIASATVDYRLSPAVAHPSHAHDVADALAWLGTRSSEFGFDPKRIYVVGHSAGGHIAATIATDPTLLALAKPAGFVGLEGIYDIPDLAKRWPTYPDWFLNKAFGSDTTKWPKASPTQLDPVSRSPWLVVHSMDDELVDSNQAVLFVLHLGQCGVKVDLLQPKGKRHFEVVSSLGKAEDEVTEAIVKFVMAS